MFSLPSLSGPRYEPNKDWKVTRIGKAFFLVNKKDRKLRYPLDDVVGEWASFLGIEKIRGKNIQLLVYYSDSLGTSEIAEIFNAVVYSPSQKKFYGKFPYRVRYIKGKKQDVIEYASFRFDRDHFEVTDKALGLKKKVKY